VAVLVDALTDNRNRTTAEIRKLFEVGGGSLGSAGCVSYLFQKKGIVRVPSEEVSEDRLMEICLEAGAEDLGSDDGVLTVTCEPSELEAVKTALKEAEINYQDAELTMFPNSVVPCDASTGKKVLELIEKIEDNDDVQNVYANFEIPEEVFAAIESSD
jgi:YebC/PmpR family DNA-binding regulatory protein